VSVLRGPVTIDARQWGPAFGQHAVQNHLAETRRGKEPACELKIFLRNKGKLQN